MLINNASRGPELNRQTLDMLFPNKDYVPVQLTYITEYINKPGKKYFRLPKSKIAYSMGSLTLRIGDLTMDEFHEYLDQSLDDSVYEGNVQEIKIEEPENYQNYIPA